MCLNFKKKQTFRECKNDGKKPGKCKVDPYLAFPGWQVLAIPELLKKLFKSVLFNPGVA